MIGLIIIGILLLVGAAVGSYYVSVGLKKGNYAKVAAYCAAVLVLGLGFLIGLQMIAAGGAVEGLKRNPDSSWSMWSTPNKIGNAIY